MTLRCRKGDMAIVLFGTNMGRFCTVYEYVGADAPLNTITGERMPFKDVWAVAFGTETHRDGKRWVCPDMHLLPIRPGDLDETEETEKELTV